MKWIFYFILFLQTISASQAQEWIRAFGSPPYSFIGVDVIEYYDKGYVLLGSRSDGEYVWIIKTDINGVKLWDQKIGYGDYAIIPFNIVQTYDNGLVFGGALRKYLNQWDAFILKLNACGSIDWCSVIHTPGIPDDAGRKINQSVDGGYFLFGLYNDLNPNHTIHLFKFDSLGSLVWHQYYLPDSLAFSDLGRDILVDSSGCLITGNCYYPDPGQGGGWLRPYYIHTDNDGNKQWSLVYTSEGYYHGSAESTIKSTSGIFYSAGRHAWGDGDSPALIKLSSNGSGISDHDLIDSTDLGGGYTIDLIYDSVLFIGGGWKDYDSTAHYGVFKTDTQGNAMKYKTFPYPIYSANGTVVTLDRKYLCVSTSEGSVSKIYLQKFNPDLEYDSNYTQQFIYDSLCPGGVISDTIDPDCDLIVNIEEVYSDPAFGKLRIFPNPATTKVIIDLPKYLVVYNSSGPIPSTTVYHQWENATLMICDLFGHMIMEKQVSQQQGNVEINTSSWSNGIFLVRLIFHGQTVCSDRIIKQ